MFVDVSPEPGCKPADCFLNGQRKIQLADQEAQGLRKLNLGRDQILNRLWELATLSHEVTRGAITGQIKALSMIIAIEGLIPDRRFSPSATQPATRILEPEPTPVPTSKSGKRPVGFQHGPQPTPVANPFINPEKLNRVPGATGGIFDAILDRGISLRLSLSPDKRFPESRPGGDKRLNFIEFSKTSRAIQPSGPVRAGHGPEKTLMQAPVVGERPT